MFKQVFNSLKKDQQISKQVTNILGMEDEIIYLSIQQGNALNYISAQCGKRNEVYPMY